MSVLQLHGAVGGVGVSTLAWCLAQARSGWLLDCSTHGGGTLSAGGVPPARWAAATWPQLPGQQLPAGSLRPHCCRWEGVKLFSGGIAPPAEVVAQLVDELVAQSMPVVVDGGPRLDMARQLAVGTNQPRVWERMLATSDLLFVRLTRDGLSAHELQREAVGRQLFVVKDESAVRRAVDLGWGVSPKAQLRRVCAEIWAVVEGRHD